VSVDGLGNDDFVEGVELDEAEDDDDEDDENPEPAADEPLSSAAAPLSMGI
jgi:hypothetical protein